MEILQCFFGDTFLCCFRLRTQTLLLRPACMVSSSCSSQSSSRRLHCRNFPQRSPSRRWCKTRKGIVPRLLVWLCWNIRKFRLLCPPDFWSETVHWLLHWNTDDQCSRKSNLFDCTLCKKHTPWNECCKIVNESVFGLCLERIILSVLHIQTQVRSTRPADHQEDAEKTEKRIEKEQRNYLDDFVLGFTPLTQQHSYVLPFSSEDKMKQVRSVLQDCRYVRKNLASPSVDMSAKIPCFAMIMLPGLRWILTNCWKLLIINLLVSIPGLCSQKLCVEVSAERRWGEVLIREEATAGPNAVRKLSFGWLSRTTRAIVLFHVICKLDPHKLAWNAVLSEFKMNQMGVKRQGLSVEWQELEEPPSDSPFTMSERSAVHKLQSLHAWLAPS